MMDKTKRRVAVVGGARTPFAKAGTALKGHSALDLATHSVNGALKKLDLDPGTVDDLAYGTVIVDPGIAAPLPKLPTRYAARAFR